MPLETIPLWGQWGILGLSLSLNLFFLVQWVRGVIVSHKMVEQANSTTSQVQGVADTFQKAWQIEVARNDKYAEAVNKLTVQGETALRMLEALPPVMHTPGLVEGDEAEDELA